MATKTSTDLTLTDLIAQTHNDEFIPIVDTLMEEFEAVEDMVWVESNGPTQHLYSQTLNEPSGTWRSINEGVDQERAQFKQLSEQMAFLESFSQVDDRLIRIAKNKEKVRSNQDARFIAGMGKTFASAFTGTPAGAPLASKSFNGLRGRMNDISAANVYGAADTGALTSLFIIQWGDSKVHMIYPAGWEHGLSKEDLGLDTVVDGDGKKYRAWLSRYELASGLVINNTKNIARVCNILSTDDIATSGVDDLLIEALNGMPGRGKGAVIYADISMLTQFDIAVKDKSNISFGASEAFGRQITDFLKRPVKLIEAIGVAESVVS
ncbi:MAG: hypothetical protein PF638_11200 [Candidatus Delongbacteria bacterium]|jgi:hypothetical protein|nr:hypothetical protein [Candidatus Delongbacteria bacterium]